MKWYQKTGPIVLLLIFFFPAGLFLMWKYAPWNKVLKVIITIIIGIIFIASASSMGGSGSSDTSSTSPVGSAVSSAAKSSSAAASSAASSSKAAASSSAASKPAVKTWADGQYKVGTDVPAGEYVVVGNGGLSYLELAKDSSGSTDSIIANDDFTTRDIVTTTAGQYLTITNGVMYAIADAPKVDTSSGTLKDGMYKVGVDLPAGEYKVQGDGSGTSYVETAKSSAHTLDSIISNDIISGNKYVTVKAGQYLTLKGATLALK